MFKLYLIVSNGFKWCIVNVYVCHLNSLEIYLQILSALNILCSYALNILCNYICK